MARGKKVSVSTLNASTIDILNVIRQNASLEYQNLVPKVASEHDVVAVGEILYGYPALANQFINALVNRIALVRVKSATFNNPYAALKKGFIDYGMSIEEVFVELAKAREFSVEKAEEREFKRTMPDVKSAFHVMNWNVQYPITIQEEDLRTAFLSMDGVQDLIAKIVDSVYKAAEYDEYLLFKYLMIKAIARGQMKPVSIGDGTDLHTAAKKFRATSNNMTFLKTEFNASAVHTNTSKEDQYIFMDSEFNAAYDVDVLSAAFNMEKADFMGRLHLIDSWNTFDNERFDVIRAGSDQIEEVTAAELALMANVKAVLIDQEWFQIYDNLVRFSEKYVASGLYWNYFLNVRKTVSSSPFSNAIVFVVESAIGSEVPDSLKFLVNKNADAHATVVTLTPNDANTNKTMYRMGQFVQTQALTEAGIAVHPYGAMIIPSSVDQSKDQVIEFVIGDAKYTLTAKPANLATGAEVTLAKA